MKEYKSDCFYCYSSNLSHFIRAFGIRYIDIGKNKKSNVKYYIFKKSYKLDQIIDLYNNIKHSI